ncbi:MAG TPA: MFS transporter, partial [Reyranella sp.]
QMGFALGAALSGLAANAAGFAVDLPREAMADVAFTVPVSLAASAALGALVALRLNARAPARL